MKLLTKILQYFLLQLLIVCASNGQCPAPYHTFTTQAEIDAFPTDYPNCIAIPGLRITGGNINNLDSLIQLTASIGSWGMQISGTNLMDLDGLMNITSIVGEAFFLGDNVLLNDISAIDNFDNVMVDYFEIVNNPLLEICDYQPVCEAVLNNNAVLNFNGNGSMCNGVSNLVNQCNNVLPVSWLRQLTLKHLNNKTIELKWTTSSRVNHHSFEIEHSEDGITFLNIHQDLREYEIKIEDHLYNHNNPHFGENYYRIKQIDVNGKFEYSNIAFINSSRNNLVIYPNPADDYINIQKFNTEHLMLINQKGIIVYNSENINLTDRIDISFLPQGMYMILINEEVRGNFCKK